MDSLPSLEGSAAKMTMLMSRCSGLNNVCLASLFLLAGLVDQGLVDVWDDTTTSNSGLHAGRQQLEHTNIAYWSNLSGGQI